MFILIGFLFTQFCTQYKDFLNSPKSDSAFVNLTRGNYKISDFADDPIVLWFWHSNPEDPKADSLLEKISLRKNFYLSSVLRWEAKEAKNYEATLSKLNLAVHFDSTAIENVLSNIALTIKYHKFGPLIKAISLPVFADFRNQIFLITNFAILFIIAIFMCALIYILVKTIYYLPSLSHRLDPQRHNKFKGIVPFLILLIPVLVLRNLYLILIGYTILLSFVLNTRERNWLRANLIILLIFFILPLRLDLFMPFLNGRGRNYLLYEMVNYDSDTVLEPINTKEKELVAYALKQQGKLEMALPIYENLYSSSNRTVAVINNLANIYFHYEDIARAETLYKYAIAAEDRGEPYFNMGLLKLKKIEYLESSQFMAEAKRRNFSSLSKEPIDIKPTNAELYKIIMTEKLRSSSLFKRIYFLPILFALIVIFLPFGYAPPFYCKACGQPICEECVKEIEKELICDNCFTRFKSTKTVEMEESLRIAVNQGRKRLNRIITYLINIIVPGAGLIYQGKNFAGLVIVFFVMLGYIPLLFLNYFVKPTGWICLPLESSFLLVAIMIAILAYLISFTQIRGTYAD